MNTVTGHSQTDNLANRLPSTSPNSRKPMMPFKTAYKLTRDQEAALVDHALLRLQQIELQLGKRNPLQAPHSHGNRDFQLYSDPYSFFGKREKYTARYYNHVADREEAGTIYEHSNVTASLSQRITAQMIAKSCNFFFGHPDDDDWFTAQGVGIEDEELAERVRKYARYKAKRCQIKANHAQALEFAWVRGESVVKTTHQERFQIYKREATFLVDPQGAPILDAHGDYILQSDSWVEQMAPAVAETPRIDQFPQQEAAEPEQQPQMVPTGVRVLRRDGVTVMPEKPLWKTDTITRRLVTWKGPDSRICYYKDFLAPIDAPGIQPGEADLIAHLYDMDAMQVAQMFSDQYEEGDAGVSDFKAAVEILKNMLSDSPTPKSAEGQPRIDFYEQTTEGSPNNPCSQIAECWLTYDADEDGQQEEIMLIVDRRTKTPIFYEYTANVTLRGLRPFDVIRPIAVDGRWYGMGAMEYFEPEQDYIDLQINRRNFREGGSGRVTFWAPWATQEGARDPGLKLNNGKTYTLREGFKASDALTYTQLPDNTEGLKELIDLFMQLMQIKSGVVNGADQQISGLPTIRTATGVNEVNSSGQELFTMFLLRLYPCVEACLRSVIDITFANMDVREVFTYFNGDAQEVLELSQDDVRDLPIHINLAITQQRDAQMLQAAQLADGVIDKFYGRALPIQQRTTEYAREMLKSLHINQPEEIISPIDPQLAMSPDQLQGQGIPPEQQPATDKPMHPMQLNNPHAVPLSQ